MPKPWPLRLSLVATLALAALPGTRAEARDSAIKGRSAALQSILDCRALSEGAQRLACYDAAAAKVGEAQTRGDIVVIDRAQAAAVHREAFGLPMPSLDIITRALNPGDVDRVEGVVRALRADPSGRWTFSLEDGAVWRQIDGDLMRPPRAGSKVAIRRGALGSFLMNVDDQAAVKVHRDQ